MKAAFPLFALFLGLLEKCNSAVPDDYFVPSSTARYPFRVSAVVEDEMELEDQATRMQQIQIGQLPRRIPNRNQSHGFRKWLNKTKENYDNRLRPLFGEKPLVIKLGMFLIGISSISEARMEFTAELFFHETWTDERLRFNPKEFGTDTLTLPLDAPEWLWLPDTTFLNALRSSGPKPGSVSHMYYMRLSYTGAIQYSRRLSVTAECQMDLTMYVPTHSIMISCEEYKRMDCSFIYYRYPFDKQACKLELSSYGFTIEDIVYKWALYPNSIPKHIQLQDFYSTDNVTDIFIKTYVAGKFSVPTLCMVFTRHSGFCFIQLFVPATAVVASSWISLWLQSETQFADMVSIILAIIFLSYSYNTVMPKVSYVKAMDIYLIACFIFAFLSLVKLAIVKYMHTKVNKRKQRLRAQSASLLHFPAAFEDLIETVALTTNANSKHDHVSHEPLRHRTPSMPVLKAAASSAAVPPPPPTNAYRDNYWRCMRAFHVGSQLVLPLAFAAFGIFYFFIYPKVKTNAGVCAKSNMVQ